MSALYLLKLRKQSQTGGVKLESLFPVLLLEMSDNLDIYCAVCQDMEKRLDGLKEVESMSNEENSLQNALAWAIVASSKAQLEKLEQQSGADGPSAQQRAEEELAQAREELETLKCNIASQVNFITNCVKF